MCVREREIVTAAGELPSLGSLLEYLQWPGLSQAEDGSWGGLASILLCEYWGRRNYLRVCIGRKLELGAKSECQSQVFGVGCR